MRLWPLKQIPILFCLATVTPQKVAAPPAMNAAAEARLALDVPALMDKGGIPGLSIAVIREGKTVWMGNFGVQSEATKRPVTNDTRFNVGSLSKPVFAYGVLKLVDAGKLRLDEPLAPFVPKEFTQGDPRFQQITARLVLSHRTGFPNWPGDGQPLTIHFNPGERFSYSGVGMVFLQLAVEKITGKSLSQYMQETVLQPLGMKNSSYVWEPGFENNIAVGHKTNGVSVDLTKSERANAASSLVTTAEDYAIFLNAILNGVGLKSSTIREMETPQIALDPNCINCVEVAPTGKLSTTMFWGLGFGIEKTSEGISLWHWGDYDTFKAYFTIRPATKSGVVYLTNSQNGLSIGPQILAQALGGEQPAFGWLQSKN